MQFRSDFVAGSGNGGGTIDILGPGLAGVAAAAPWGGGEPEEFGPRLRSEGVLSWRG